MTDKQIFSLMPIDKESRDPDAQMVRLTAAWRRERGLDDSFENMKMSTTAVLQEHTHLARAYFDQPFNTEKHGTEYFSKNVEFVET